MCILLLSSKPTGLVVFSFVTVMEHMLLKLKDLNVFVSMALFISPSEPFHNTSLVWCASRTAVILYPLSYFAYLVMLLHTC